MHAEVLPGPVREVTVEGVVEPVLDVGHALAGGMGDGVDVADGRLQVAPASALGVAVVGDLEVEVARVGRPGLLFEKRLDGDVLGK